MRNSLTTHPRKNARRARLLARWDSVKHGPHANVEHKNHEYVVLCERVNNHMTPRQIKTKGIEHG